MSTDYERERETYPTIEGLKCHLCGGSLFLAAGNYITCSYVKCPNPDYAEAVDIHVRREVRTGKIEEAKRHRLSIGFSVHANSETVTALEELRDSYNKSVDDRIAELEKEIK